MQENWCINFSKQLGVHGATLRAVEAACDELGFSEVEKASYCMAGEFVHVMDLQRWWIEHFKFAEDLHGTLDKLSAGFEEYFSFLIDNAHAVFAVLRYWLPYKAECFAEHVWKLVDYAWSKAHSHDTTFKYYTKRMSLGYAYGRTLCWWDQNQGADLIDIMQEWHRYVQQVQTAGKGFSQVMEGLVQSGLRTKKDEKDV